MKINKYLLIASLAAIASCSDSDSDDATPGQPTSTSNQSPPETTPPQPIPDPADPDPDPVFMINFEDLDKNQPSFVSLDDTTPSDKQWVKLESMSDEFEGDTWDRSKWFRSKWDYPVPVNIVDGGTENLGVEDGKLYIRATLDEGKTRWFQSARLHSIDETSYPMYTEASIKSSHISSYSTYWLNNGDSANRDEIDIIENNSKPSCNCQPNFPTLMKSQYFHVDSRLSPQEARNADDFDSNKLSPNNPKRGIPWNEDFHIFGVWWKDANNIQFYLDGEPAGSVVVGEQRGNAPFLEDREFTRKLEIIFDMWTNEATWLGGLPEKSELLDNSINTMRVDWVRTWKLEDK